jgi:alkanesulfonate monooxygenase SsuD/methylene tetrahydromethanopterin reductase-like flavin-dependent oxidoreductase (luciferase family)
MRVGAVFPQTEIGSDPADVRRWATTVEDLGYDHILAYDHVLGAGTDTRPGWQGYTSESLFHEVFVLYGYLAAVTRRVELVTGVLILPLRLGIGVGWNPVEYEGLGLSFKDRGIRSEEQIALLRELWAAPLVTFEGRWEQVDNAGIKPRPAAGRIPVWLGGSSDRTLRRAARIGDGWMPNADLARETEKVERLRGYAREAGRDPADIGLDPRLNLATVPPAERAAYVAAWQRLGATHLTIATMGAGYATVDDHLGALETALADLRRSGLHDAPARG